MKPIVRTVLILSTLSLVQACGASQPKTDSDQVSFSRDIQPMFKRHCVVCHGDMGGVSLASYDDIMSPERPEPIVVPGDPESSTLVKVIDEAKMPAILPDVHDPLGGSPLSDRELRTLRNWVRQGAKNN